MDEREQVLGRFYRGSNARGAGSGLGLAIVGEVAQLHGASVSIDSVPREGQRNHGANDIRAPFPACYIRLNGQSHSLPDRHGRRRGRRAIDSREQRRPRRRTRRGMLVTLATVGGNLPDIDLVLTYRGFVRDKLGYLLEHRGYTHTVLGCLVLATLLFAAEGWARYRRLSMTRNDHLMLAAVAAFGTLLHLGMDALNSYGVIPSALL